MKIPPRSERGVAALEFALIAPFLILLVLAIVDFGYRYKVAADYNAAAAAAARSMTIENDLAAAGAAASHAGASVAPSVSYVDAAGHTYASGAKSCADQVDGRYLDVVVTLTNSAVGTVTNVYGSTFTVTGKAVARCAG